MSAPVSSPSSGNAQVAVIPVVAWAFLDERPQRRLIAVAPLVAVGVVLVSGLFDHHPYGSHPAAGVMFGAVTALTYSAFILLLRAASTGPRHSVEPLLISTAVAAVVATVAGLIIGDAGLVLSWPVHVWLATLALTSQVIGWLLISTSLPRLPAATTSMVLTIQPVGALTLAAIVFGENPASLQLTGALLILTSVVASSSPLPRTRARVASKPTPKYK